MAAGAEGPGTVLLLVLSRACTSHGRKKARPSSRVAAAGAEVAANRARCAMGLWSVGGRPWRVAGFGGDVRRAEVGGALSPHSWPAHGGGCRGGCVCAVVVAGASADTAPVLAAQLVKLEGALAQASGNESRCS